MFAAILIYVVGLAVLNAYFGMGRGFVALIPIVSAAWLYGTRGGLTAGLLAMPVNRGLLLALGDPIADSITPMVLIMAGTSAATVGFILGYMRDLNLRYQETTARLEKSNQELSQAMDKIKTLSGMIPICSHCKSIRDDEGFWRQLEGYLHEHSELEFTHGICPTCLDEHYPSFKE